MQSNETTTSATGGGGGEGEGCRGGEGARKCGALKKKIYIIPYILPQAQQHILMDTELWLFMESVDSSWEALFAFGLPSLMSTNIY